MRIHFASRRIGIAIFFLVLGTTLVSNPLYLYPEGAGDPKITYTVAEVDSQLRADQAIGLDQRILTCGGQRSCVLEERILEDGPVRYDGTIRNNASYPAVRIGSDVYVPTTETEDGSTVLDLEAVSSQEAVAHVAVPVDDLRPEVRTAVSTGSVTVYGDGIEVFERGWIFEYDGKYYFENGVRSTPTPWGNDFLLPALRGVTILSGIALLLSAGWIAREAIEIRPH